ncbi:hypothetical protein M0R01_00630 [bacterium]|nr:hypothetical protein [bacterium]
MQYLKGEKEKEAIKWMNSAGQVAKSALCHRAKCGAVIVMNGEIIGSGYNAPPLNDEKNRTCSVRDYKTKPGYDRTCCIHAEWRAMVDALKKYPDRVKGSKLYFCRVSDGGEILKSGKPFCTVCSRLALDIGIGHFLLWHEEGICEYGTDEYNKLSHQYIYGE